MLATSPVFPVLAMMRDSKSVIGLNMLTLQDAKGLGDYIQPLTELMDRGVVDPVVAEAFPVERAAHAHRYLSERKNVGKVVLTF
jgi:NADPH:quinone reductase-like Zn-dependent oxidoreductase